MPYVTQNRRDALDAGAEPESCGELNYVITKLVLAYLDSTGRRYANFNEVIGVLQCAQLEMYRRAVAPYEDQKCTDNGDVYTT